MEVLLQQEVERVLSRRRWDRKHGGMEGRVTIPELWTLAHDLRIAESIRVRIGSFPASNFEELLAGFQRLPWAVYYAREALPPVEVQSSASALYHDDAVAQRLEAFFLERSGRRDGEAQAVPAVQVRIVNDMVVVSVDASGAPLHRRGLREAVLRAPLRETYAAACLRVSGLDASMSLADPFCGSGVFLSERAGMDGGFALPRRFAFEDWAHHDASLYAQWLSARSPLRYPEGLRLFGGDQASAAIEASRLNLAVWDAGASLALRKQDAGDFLRGLSPDTDVICNPPWGLRMRGAGAVGALMGDWLRDRDKNAKGDVVTLVAGYDFLRASGVRWRELLSFRDGGTTVRLMRYEARG